MIVDKRDGRGRLDNKPFSVNVDDAKLAAPVKKSSVLVLAGKCKGSTGIVKVTQLKKIPPIMSLPIHIFMYMPLYTVHILIFAAYIVYTYIHTYTSLDVLPSSSV